MIIDIARESPLWEESADAAIIETAHAALEAAGLVCLPEAELSIVLTDDAQICGLNRAWRSKDKATNVLSFPAAEAGTIGTARMLGDVVLARETIAREADELGVPFEDHLRHLVVHGLLHLFGYDHEREADAETMEALETAVLARLGIADPYAGRPLVDAARNI
jgi:probable rRNA maturation factor